MKTKNKYRYSWLTAAAERRMDILTAVQLLNSECEIQHQQRMFLTPILDFQKSSFDSPSRQIQMQVQLPYVSSLHQSLPLLKDRLSLAFKARLGFEAPCLAERILLETALFDLYGELPVRPTAVAATTTTTTIGNRGVAKESLIRTRLCNLLFRSRSGLLEAVALREMVSLCASLASKLPALMKRLGLYEWSYVDQGFGSEWEKLLPFAVVGRLLFDSREIYRGPGSYAKIWAHDIITREGADVAVDAYHLASIPRDSWSLDDLAFLTDNVGLDQKDNQSLTLLHVAILDRRPDVVRRLIQGGARASHRIRGKRFSLFHFAAAVGYEESYKELHSHRDLVQAEEVRDRNGMLPLHIAALRGHTRMVEAILSANYDKPDYVNRETSSAGQTALHLAIARSEKDETAVFLARYPGVDLLVDREVRQTALHVAASRKKYSLFYMFLCEAPGELVNMQNEDGETPLHILARHGDRGPIEAALRVPYIQADLTADDGFTPLINAVMEAEADAVQILAGRPDVDVSALRRSLEPFGQSAIQHARQVVDGGGVRSEEYGKILRFLRDNFEELAVDIDTCDTRSQVSAGEEDHS